jgi:hypothetical protein
MEALRSLHSRHRLRVMEFVRHLQENPFLPGDAIERDSTGLEIELKVLQTISVAFHVDHAGREVRILPVRRRRLKR